MSHWTFWATNWAMPEAHSIDYTVFFLETFSLNLSTRELSDTFRMWTIEPDDRSVFLHKSLSPQIRDSNMEER